jgi:hypothetical protein
MRERLWEFPGREIWSVDIKEKQKKTVVFSNETILRTSQSNMFVFGIQVVAIERTTRE